MENQSLILFTSGEPSSLLALHSLQPLIEGAIKGTIPLTLITFVIGMILALFTALMRISGSKVLGFIAGTYISIIRGTPLLVQLFIIFYGLPNIGITLDPYHSAILGFSLNVGAYAAEIVRAAILSIPKGQWEAGFSIGMTYTQTLRRIILPQAARVSVPPLSNTFISLIKDTSLASLILVTEMFRKAQEIAAPTFDFLNIYVQAAAIYWVICTILSFIQYKMEIRLERHLMR